MASPTDADAFEKAARVVHQHSGDGVDTDDLGQGVGRDAVVTYNGTDCTYDGPTTVTAGRVGFMFETVDSTWVAAITQLTGESTIEEVVAWVEANPDTQEAPPGIDDVILVPPGATTYVTVEAPGVGVVCSTLEPGPLLIAASLTVE